MNALSRNVKRPENLLTLRALKNVINKKLHNLVFLMETRLPRHDGEIIGLETSFDFCFEVHRTSLGGGLLILWKSCLDDSIKFLSPWHIDMVIRLQNGSMFKGSGFYGHPKSKAW